MKKLKLSAIAVLTSITATVVLNGCSGKDGAPGATGPAGANGSAGAPGNANVNTYTFSTTSSSWNVYQSTGWDYYYINVSMDLTGGVEVYIYDNTLNAWSAMPLVSNNVSASFETSSGTIWIVFTPANGTGSLNNPGAFSFKAVTIPPAMQKLHPNLNYKNYSEVARTFGIN